MAPPGDDSVKLDVSEATEVRHKAVNPAEITHVQYELEVAETEEQPRHDSTLALRTLLQFLAGVTVACRFVAIFLLWKTRQSHDDF